MKALTKTCFGHAFSCGMWLVRQTKGPRAQSTESRSTERLPDTATMPLKIKKDNWGYDGIKFNKQYLHSKSQSVIINEMQALREASIDLDANFNSASKVKHGPAPFYQTEKYTLQEISFIRISRKFCVHIKISVQH